MPAADIQEKIREFIRKNPGKSEGVLIRYMAAEEICSRDTTRKHANLLKGSGDIIVEKDKRRNNKTHYLYLNDKSEFNQIDQALSKMEKVIGILPEPVQKTLPKTITVSDTDLPMWSLQILLFRTSLIPFERDSQILYKKIIKLMVTLTLKDIKAKKNPSP